MLACEAFWWVITFLLDKLSGSINVFIAFEHDSWQGIW
jgi:hypothetical protein